MDERFTYDGEDVGEAFSEWLTQHPEIKPVTASTYRMVRTIFVGGMNIGYVLGASEV